MKGAEGWYLLDLSNLLWGSENTCSPKKDGEQLSEAEGWVVCSQWQTELQVIVLSTAGGGQEKPLQTQRPFAFRDSEKALPWGRHKALLQYYC